MANCGWTRLAYLLFALSILMVLAQVDNPSADPRPLASRAPSVADNEGDLVSVGQARRGPAQDASVDQDAPVSTASPPLFYRPVPANPALDPVGEPGSDPVCADLGASPRTHRIAFPLPREYLDSYENTWGATRPQGGHEGTDLMVPVGTAEYAVTDGTIVAVAGANENGWNPLGGYAVMLRAAYSVGPIEQGDLFYYAHLNRESVREIGTRVSAGQTVGYVGDTGRGPEVTRGLVPLHLHLGWYGAGSAVTSAAMNPYPLLEWIKAHGGAISGGSNARYCEARRTGGPSPSTGADRWPAPPSPGVSPDRSATVSNSAPADQGAQTPDGGSPDAPGTAAPKPAAETPAPSAGNPPSSGSPNPPASGSGSPPGENEGSEQGATATTTPEPDVP